jgi:hypothetical protein
MRSKMALISALALIIVMSACSGSSDPKSTDPASTLNGNWQITLVDSADTKAAISQSGSLLQAQESISGSLIFNDSACSGVGGVQGSLTGNNVSLTVNPTGAQITLTGSVGSATDTSCGTGQSCMGGTYTTLSTGCTDGKTVPSTGTWTAVAVSPFSGSVTGAFASNKGVTTATVTGTVTQGSNSGSSSTPLTGSLTFGGGFCYPSANIVGSISGTSVVMNLADSTGVQIGQVYGTASTDGTTFSGTYNYIGLGTGAPKACVDSSSGIATFTIGASS